MPLHKGRTASTWPMSARADVIVCILLVDFGLCIALADEEDSRLTAVRFSPSRAAALLWQTHTFRFARGSRVN